MIDVPRLLLKHRLGLVMPERDHESFWTSSTSRGTSMRITISCAAYRPMFHRESAPVVSALLNGFMMSGHFAD